jgi:hypothetical protein
MRCLASIDGARLGFSSVYRCERHLSEQPALAYGADQLLRLMAGKHACVMLGRALSWNPRRQHYEYPQQRFGTSCGCTFLTD